MIDQLKSLGIEKGKPFDPERGNQDDALRRGSRGTGVARGEVRCRPAAVLLATQPLDLPGASRPRQGGAGRLRRPQYLSDRQPRPRLQLRLHRHQAAGRRPDVPDLDQGQGRQRLRRRPNLSPHGAAERAGRAVLVGDRLRPPDPRADQEHAARQPLLADPRDAEERRRLDRCLLRPARAGGQGEQLGADRPGPQIRADVPRLCTHQGPVREDLGAAGRGEGASAGVRLHRRLSLGGNRQARAGRRRLPARDRRLSLLVPHRFRRRHL